MVNVDILPTAQAAEGYDFSCSVAVAIDVLRATSVISMAIENGSRQCHSRSDPRGGVRYGREGG